MGWGFGCLQMLFTNVVRKYQISISAPAVVNSMLLTVLKTLCTYYTKNIRGV